MTLCSCVFGLAEAGLLHVMQREMMKEGMMKEGSSKGTKFPILFKIVEYLVGLGFILYDARSQDRPGAGTTVLVVLASLSQILLLFLKAYDLWKYRNPPPDVVQDLQ